MSETENATKTPVSFSKAANPETEIGVDLCIRVNGGVIKLDMALQKDAPSTQQFMDAVAVLMGLKDSV